MRRLRGHNGTPSASRESWSPSAREQWRSPHTGHDFHITPLLLDASDPLMKDCKLTLANLVKWARDQCFPAAYVHVIWARLTPFSQLSGSITSSRQMVTVQLRPFHDRQDNRDLVLLRQRVNKKHFHLPDGRLLLFSLQEMARPILHQQQRLNASRPDPDERTIPSLKNLNRARFPYG